MLKSCAVLIVLAAAATADNAASSYGAPAVNSGYGAPAGGGNSGYAAPTGYAAPDDSYSYDTGYQSYTAPAEADSGFGLGKLEELLPLFLIVLAAIILGQLFSPLLSQLMVILVGILPLALDIKAPIVNAILSPFGLTLCDITNPAAPTVVPAGRAFTEWGLSEESGKILADTIATVLENFK